MHRFRSTAAFALSLTALCAAVAPALSQAAADSVPARRPTRMVSATIELVPETGRPKQRPTPTAPPEDVAPPAAAPSLPANAGPDPMFKSLSSLTTDIRPPAERDARGRPLPSPEDATSRVPPLPPFAAPLPDAAATWRGEIEQQLDLEFCFRPLYFEEPLAERYGVTNGLLQPAVSAAHFFGSALILPAKTLREKPNQCSLPASPDLPGDPPLRQIRSWRLR